MKKLTVFLSLIATFLFTGLAQASIVNYGYTAKVASINNGTLPKVKVGDKVYIQFKLDSDVLPIETSPEVYAKSFTEINVYFFAANSQTPYHQVHYKKSTASIRTSNTILAQNIAGIGANYNYDAALIPSSIPNTSYGLYKISGVLQDISFDFNIDPDAILPSTFRISDAGQHEVALIFINNKNVSQKPYVNLSDINVIFDNPDSIEDQI